MPSKRITEKNLEQKGITSVLYNGEKYFNVKEIRKFFPDVKFNTDNIKDLPDVGKSVKYTDIELMTDFDKTIRKFRDKR